MLDERDSILLADATLRGGRHLNTIWRVFAHRGMGFFAGALDGNDVTPVRTSRATAGECARPALDGHGDRFRHGYADRRGAVTVARQGWRVRLTNPSGDDRSRTASTRSGNVVVGTYPKVAVASKLASILSRCLSPSGPGTTARTSHPS